MLFAFTVHSFNFVDRYNVKVGFSHIQFLNFNPLESMGNIHFLVIFLLVLSSKPSLTSDFDQCLPPRFNGQIYPNRQWAQHVLANRLFYSSIAISEATRILQLGKTVEVKTVSQRLDETRRRHARIFRILF